MQLRILKSHDYSQWLNLWNNYQVFYQVKLDDAVTEITFSRLLNEEEDMYCLVIEDQEKLIGLVHFIFHRSTWTEGNYCYLQDLFVEQHARNQGIGRQLIEGVYEKAAKYNCSRVYWLTHASNVEARWLYDNIAINTGFIQYRQNLG